jgi:hypothetical protein
MKSSKGIYFVLSTYDNYWKGICLSTILSPNTTWHKLFIQDQRVLFIKRQKIIDDSRIDPLISKVIFVGQYTAGKSCLLRAIAEKRSTYESERRGHFVMIQGTTNKIRVQDWAKHHKAAR